MPIKNILLSSIQQLAFYRPVLDGLGQLLSYLLYISFLSIILGKINNFLGRNGECREPNRAARSRRECSSHCCYATPSSYYSLNKVVGAEKQFFNTVFVKFYYRFLTVQVVVFLRLPSHSLTPKSASTVSKRIN